MRARVVARPPLPLSAPGGTSDHDRRPRPVRHAAGRPTGGARRATAQRQHDGGPPSPPAGRSPRADARCNSYRERGPAIIGYWPDRLSHYRSGRGARAPHSASMVRRSRRPDDEHCQPTRRMLGPKRRRCADREPETSWSAGSPSLAAKRLIVEHQRRRTGTAPPRVKRDIDRRPGSWR